jgi:demethylmenaquinone methyltransferase/2-methoxy-6-polyprenyl-1,4-benzoquinol methylase
MSLARSTEADVTGIDISESMLARGRQRVVSAGLDQRIRLQPGRAEDLPFPSGSFDAVSFTYLLRYVGDPEKTVAEMARVLRPGGTLACLDFFVPPHPAWHTLWWLYTRAALPVAGLVLGGSEWWRVGRFLGPNITSFYSAWPLARLTDAWNAAGIVGVEHRAMSVGGGLVMWGRKQGA